MLKKKNGKEKKTEIQGFKNQILIIEWLKTT